ncbi:MAG: BON domain-containing protein [Gammaproteobacteria bacterium]|jgi:osmotically-inducible protein OsmY
MTGRGLFLGTLLATLVSISGCAPIVVGGAATTASIAHDRRTTGSVIEDQAIEMRIKNALTRDAEIDEQAHINVTSYNGIVLLSGEAPSEALRARAGQIAREDEESRRVHNEIQIAAPSAMMARSSDTWITTKVKSALFGVGIDGFDPTRVKVVTENGTVFLMGILTQGEGSAVIDQARQVSGVQRIVKLFEYTD